MKNAARLGIFLLMAFLAACDVLAPRDVGNANRFNLQATLKQNIKARSGTLTVQLPNASSVLDTYRISVLFADGRQDYVAGARWSDFLPSLVQTSLRDGFSQSGIFKQVNDDTDGIGGQYLLASEIQGFSVVYAQAGTAPSVHLRMAFDIKRSDNGRVLKQFLIDKTQPTSENSMTAIRTAFNDAFSALANDALTEMAKVAR